MLESRSDFVICAWSECSGLDCPAEFIECLANHLARLLRVAGLMLVVNRQLLVSLIPRTRVSERASPKVTGQGEIAIAFRKARKRTPRGAVCVDR